MKRPLALALAAFAGAAFAADSDVRLPVLKAGTEIYSNVTVLNVTATDLYFSHAGGMGNAKLKSLDPELRKKFNYDPARADATAKKQVEANAKYHFQVLSNDAAATPRNQGPPPATYDDGDVVVPKLFARSFRGQPPPQVFVSDWLTPVPNTGGRFALVVFWTSWAAPCRKSIPRLNELAERYKERMVVLAVSNEPVEDIRKNGPGEIKFYLGTDQQARSLKAFEVTAIPHVVLIDPKGIVRFEGAPVYLEDSDLDHLLDKYGKP